MRIGLFLLQERLISCCVKRSRFFFTRVPCAASYQGRRELNCSPEDQLCLCARTGSGICASKCKCLLSVHLSVHLRVLLSAIQRKIIVTEGQEVHVGSASQRGELGLV